MLTNTHYRVSGLLIAVFLSIVVYKSIEKDRKKENAEITSLKVMNKDLKLKSRQQDLINKKLIQENTLLKSQMSFLKEKYKEDNQKTDQEFDQDTSQATEKKDVLDKKAGVFNPLNMSWPDFYQLTGHMQLDDKTLVRNIFNKLEKEIGLNKEQRWHVYDLLRLERLELSRHFKKKYGEKISHSNFHKLSEEEQRGMLEYLKNQRQIIREQHEAKLIDVLPDDEQRAAVFLHLRNDFSIAFESTGRVTGGIGIPKNKFKLFNNDK